MTHPPDRSRVGAMVIFLLALVTIVACDDMILDDRTLSIEGTGTVEGIVFLDADGDSSQGTLDQPVGGLRLWLMPPGEAQAVSTARTDSAGLFRMREVPVGEFRLVLDSTTVPDTVRVFDYPATPFILLPQDTVRQTLRLSFPHHTLEEVRGLPPGRRIFTHGIVLNSRDPFGDGAVHLKEDGVYLRAIEVERSNLAPGDSVRFSGRTGLQAGQPVLQAVKPLVLVRQAAFIQPVDVTSAVLATADGGRLDAALVRILNAEVLDTVSVAGQLIVSVDDGTGPVEVLLRDFIAFDRASLKPDSTLMERAVGLMVPVQAEDGTVRWRLNPRSRSDLLVVALPPLQASMTPDSAEVAVGTTFDFSIVATGGTVIEEVAWTCASSDNGVAAVAFVPVGCRAMAVAVGSTTVTAVVTKGNDTVSVSVELTVID